MKPPEGVEIVRARGRTYYYWNPGRGTARESERIRLPDMIARPAAFWREVEGYRAGIRRKPHAAGSFADLVDRYRASTDYTELADKTRRTYDVHLNRFAAIEGWGSLNARELTPAGVLAERDARAPAPVMANQMLSVGRTLFDWAIPLGLADLNPFDKVKPINVPDRGHVPWPGWAVDAVLAAAPEDLRRVVLLGRMTCQRESDLVRLGPDHRERNGLWCRPVKTRKRRRAFFIPLTTVDALDLDRWARTPIIFENTRWKAPIARERVDLYIFSPTGQGYTPDSLRARWGRWLLKTEKGQALADRWRTWLAECVRRYEWEIDPDDARGPTLHGLRGSGILLRHALGYDTGQIANDVGMSRPMVEHYMRFKEQMEIATDGARRLAVVRA